MHQQLYVPGFMKNCTWLMRTFTFRLKLWKRKEDSVKKSSNPKLCSFPPTAAALDLNIKRAYYQTMIWKSCLHGTYLSLYIQNSSEPTSLLSIHASLQQGFTLFQGRYSNSNKVSYLTSKISTR